jgi:hypothetical protein
MSGRTPSERPREWIAVLTFASAIAGLVKTLIELLG